MCHCRLAARLIQILCLIPWLGSTPAYSEDGRPFRMGFSTFPRDKSSQAQADLRKFFRDNADIVLEHIQGVPWPEALHAQPFPQKLLDDWQRAKSVIPPSAYVYLAVSPLDTYRAGLAEYGGWDDGMIPRTGEYKDRTFNDPIVRKAYLKFCERAFEFFRPNFMAVGVEVNHLYHTKPKEWSAYVELHKFVYQQLKKKHPTLPIFATVTLDSLLLPGSQDHEAMLHAYEELMPYNDIVAVSFYPFFRGIKADPALAWFFKQFDKFSKPYAVAETGEEAEDVEYQVKKRADLEALGAGSQPKSVRFLGNPTAQAAYYEKVLSLAKARKFKFVISFFSSDYSAQIEPGAEPSFLPFPWRHCGLVDDRGLERPAYEIWKKYFSMRLQQ